MQRPGPEWERHKTVSEAGTFNVFLNPAHGAALTALAEEFDAELVWATMGWEDHANLSIGPLVGLPQMPVIVMDETFDYGSIPRINPKTPMVARYVQGRPFVWFDDETGRVDRLWLADHPNVGAFTLIHVGERRGLNDKHIAQARAWLAGRREIGLIK
jgi:hypothetical protein